MKVKKKDYDAINLGKSTENLNSDDNKNTEEDKKEKDEEEKEKESITTDVSDIDVEMYDAVLFATDDDFLEKSKIRAIFKKNAVSPEDAKLFEMPEYKGTNNFDEGQLILYDDATLCDICFPEPPANVTGIRAILFQYRYILISVVIIGIFIPIFLIK